MPHRFACATCGQIAECPRTGCCDLPAHRCELCLTTSPHRRPSGDAIPEVRWPTRMGATPRSES